MISLQASTPPAETGSTSVGPASTGPASTGPAEIALRIGGTLVGVALAIASGVWEAVLTTWYVIISGHVIRLPVAALLAVIGNLAIFWFVRKVTGKLSLVIFPVLAWLAVMVAAGNVTSDGDLIVSGTWVGVTTLLFGTAAWAVPGYRAILKQRPAPVGNGPAGARPAAGKPVAVKPTSSKPASGKPASGKPAGGKPAGGKPAGGKPAGGKPASGTPTGGEPASGTPTGGKPTSGKPAGGTPTGDTSASGTPTGATPGPKQAKPAGAAVSAPKNKRR